MVIVMEAPINLRERGVTMLMKLEEAKIKFNGQWLFMINCKNNNRGSVLEGEVVLHSKKRAEVLEKMSLYGKGSGQTYFSYVGDYPDDYSVLI
jgi:hypothetical protein